MIVLGGQVTVGGEVVGELSKMFEWRVSKVHYEGLLLLVGREVIEKVLVTTVKVQGGNVANCGLLTRCLRKF